MINEGRFFNYSSINVHFPHELRPYDEKEAFYAKLEQVYDGCSRRDVKIVIGDMNAQVVFLEDGWNRIRTAIFNAAEAILGMEAPTG